MTVKIDEKRLINAIVIALNKKIDDVCKILIEFIVAEIYQSNAGNPEWKNDVIQSIKFRSAVKSNALVREIGILNQNEGTIYKAMLENYGIGQKADIENNPYIEEYFNSSYYNKTRDNMKIYSRPNEPIFDPDENAWKQSCAKSRYEIPAFSQGQEGSHFWEDVFGASSGLAESYFNEAILDAINSVNFADYLLVRSD
ncbi:hypothetical protein BJV85_002872 [Clostridium acetobutylicum]|uniref:Uncharacterized protein n=1 Tax=Clostridium acetobutylicum (strain ATCC 824 / DSM 792 / JCM 1419 / IAM 19013 / LMG 5710 / NBRC 13948 / NRRL B-527 / VKM B-1787 / 2291 / W) TaxID=272562 RepID=Q97JZ6_CLOAB|nr:MULTISPECIES: hypothetical protein [Clostridium]AAK79099.1 Hypothetical protein CA_C1126 [Clostridium acetobutylicum ATCC 824]ADZ20175.1 Conserved hypothetical protein [Clostridium acetobutylicum EA 2018]AEI31636.1 hypothetical protein SMB_G1145 [Clostridium acetobutylicum DSM 1731]AWV81647.1 hypothetical protein DK921_16425 [Clostridium acetobutylicum]MBC2393293.1 hypothetical protein [Clostridium acetobutylicum]